MMSPVTNRAEVDVESLTSETTEVATMKKELPTEETPSAAIEPQPRTLKVVHRNRSGAAKLDAALQVHHIIPFLAPFHISHSHSLGVE